MRLSRSKQVVRTCDIYIDKHETKRFQRAVCKAIINLCNKVLISLTIKSKFLTPNNRKILAAGKESIAERSKDIKPKIGRESNNNMKYRAANNSNQTAFFSAKSATNPIINTKIYPQATPSDTTMIPSRLRSLIKLVVIPSGWHRFMKITSESCLDGTIFYCCSWDQAFL